MKFFIITTFEWKLAMQIMSNDKTVRSDIVQDSKDFNSPALTR